MWLSMKSTYFIKSALLHLLIVTIAELANGYPPPQTLPTAFAFQPSQQQLAMAAAGLDPIMPINYPGLGSMSSARQGIPMGMSMLTSPSIPLQLAMMQNGQQHPSSMTQQFYIRNSPYQQPSPFRASLSSPFGAGGGISGLQQQPFFPQGLAIGKNGGPYGIQHSVLPADIPMNVLVGQQMMQNGLDGMGHSRTDRHPFPLSPILDQQQGNGNANGNGNIGTSAFGGGSGTFGTDPFQFQQAQQEKIRKPAEEEFEQSRTEQIPSSPNLPTKPSAAAEGAQSPFESAVGSSHSSVISPQASGGSEGGPLVSAPSGDLSSSAGASSQQQQQQQQQNSLPVFLRGAQQEFIDEFKRIIRQPNSSYADQVGRIDGLVQKMDPERQLLYREFMRENDERERIHRDRVHKTVAEMSDKAQEQFAKISATLRNPNLPDQDRWDRVLQLYGRMEPELRNEFEQKFKGFSTIAPANGI